MQIQNCHSRIENELNPAMSVRATHIAIMIRAVQIRRGNMSGITLLNESIGERQGKADQRTAHAPHQERNISLRQDEYNFFAVCCRNLAGKRIARNCG